jgi:ABC-type antimicrobial peptide transport system permease subunit
VITAAGLLLGTFVGTVQHVAGVRATATLTGFTVQYQFVIVPLITAAVAAVAMAVVGAIGPAWRAGQVDVISAIGYE